MTVSLNVALDFNLALRTDKFPASLDSRRAPSHVTPGLTKIPHLCSLIARCFLIFLFFSTFNFSLHQIWIFMDHYLLILASR